MDALGLMELVLLRNACYPQDKQFSKVEIGNRFMLVKACLFDTEEIAKLAAKVKELLKEERIKDELYQADMFLQDLDIRKLGGKEHFLSFFTYMMGDVFVKKWMRRMSLWQKGTKSLLLMSYWIYSKKREAHES